MPWVYLLIAGLLEVAWAAGMKYAEGFTRFWPSVFTIIGQIASFYFLAKAMKVLPLGTAYGVWTGIGAVGSVIVGIIAFGDSRDPVRLLFVALILIGLVGLKATST